MRSSCPVFGLVLFCGVSWAQPAAAPTPESVGPPLGQEVNGYNVVNSFETGYRFRSVNGDLSKYRSDVNYGNGVRLLGSTLSVHSREGHGRFFDQIALRTLGLGNDPYQFSSLRIEKNRLYRYDLTWRLNEYFNPALRIAEGLHAMDTSRRIQDHDFVLLPQSRLRLFVGYSRNSQNGPALATVQAFDFHGDVFPFFADVRRLRNEYRFGSEIQLFGFIFNWMRGWDNFSETTPGFLTAAAPGENPNDPSVLEQFRRAEPYRGSSPYWRLNLHTDRRNWAAHARFTYAGGRRNFFFDESALGVDRLGAGRNRQILIAGRGRRPAGAGNLTLTAFPSGRVSVTNQTSFHHIRMEGDSSFRELSNATLGLELVDFQFLGIRAISNATDVTVRASKPLWLHGGYSFSTRRIRSIEGQETRFANGSQRFEQTNDLHEGIAGLRFQPVGPLTFTLDAVIGRADRPVFPISRRNYHALGARAQYKLGSLLLSAAARSDYNNNSVTLTAHSSRARNYSFDASWAPFGWLAFDTGYAKLHLDTLSGVAYFASGSFDPIVGDQSVYISNFHTGNLTARFGLGSRADISVGYSRVEDIGDERRQPAGTRGGASLPVFLAAQTFPLTFESPLARFSLAIHRNIRWNVAYQFYRYREEFFTGQNYRAHTGYTSVLWSF